MSKIDPATVRDLNNPRYWHRYEQTEVPQPFYDIITNADQFTRKSITLGEFGAFELGISESTLAESITWDSWTPDPLEIHGTNGDLLLTISSIKLTAVRYDTTSPPFKQAYLRLNETWQTHAWRCTASDARPYQRRLQVKDINDGVILEFDYQDSLWCNVQKVETWRWDFAPDLFDLLEKASSAGLGTSLWRRC